MNTITPQQTAIVEAFLQDYHPAYNAIANYAPLLEAAGSIREGEEYHGASSNAILLDVAFQKVKQRLTLNAAHINALQDFFSEGYADTMASRNMLLTHFGEFPGSILEAFRAVAKKHNLPLSAVAQAEANEANRRKAILKEISNGGKAEYTVINSNGALRNYPVAELESEGTAYLEDVLGMVRAYREARNRTPSESRKALQRLQAPPDFPALPQVWRGIPLTRENLHRMDAEASRMLVRVYGEANFLNRFNGIA